MGKGFLKGGEGQSMYNQCKEDWWDEQRVS